MIIHYFPRLYDIYVKLTHKPKRYEIASQIIGSGSVLDIGCGTGLLAKYLSPKANYLGIDLNEKHLSFAKKKGLEVKKMDCMDVEKYPERDVYFICDLLHHINPDHEKLIDNLVDRFPDKKIIVSEPYVIGNWAYEQIVKILDYDYVNKVWRPEWYEKDKLEKFFRENLGAEKVMEIEDDLVGIRS